MFATLVYLSALVTAAAAEKIPAHKLQWIPDPLAPTDDESLYVAYGVGKGWPGILGPEGGHTIFLTEPTSIWTSNALTFTPGKSGHILAIENKLIGDFCLDGGMDPYNGGRVYLWTCIDNHPPQEWIVEKGQVRLTGTNFCLDAVNGGGKDLQIWECTCNKNQAFRVHDFEFTLP